jgi:ParB/RepB/Spo0J family partition protein
MTTQSLQKIDLAFIKADPNNARQNFDPSLLQELADSIREQGLIQPVVVRETDSGTYQLVAGERRLRACQLLGHLEIQALVVEMDDKEAALAGLIENLQRADLDPFEEGDGYRMAIEAHGISQKDLATKLGKSEAAISRALARTRVDSGVRKQMLEAGWSASSVDTVATLGKDRQIKILGAFGGKAPTRVQLRDAVRAANVAAQPDGFVYLKKWTLSDGATWWKVGITSDPDRRDDEQNVLPVPAETLRLLRLASMDQARAVEATLHLLLANARIYGANNRELFSFSAAMEAALIAAMDSLQDLTCSA